MVKIVPVHYFHKQLLRLLLGLHHIQPSAYNNVAAYPLGKYKPIYRAVCVPEEKYIWMHAQKHNLLKNQKVH